MYISLATSGRSAAGFRRNGARTSAAEEAARHASSCRELEIRRLPGALGTEWAGHPPVELVDVWGYVCYTFYLFNASSHVQFSELHDSCHSKRRQHGLKSDSIAPSIQVPPLWGLRVVDGPGSLLFKAFKPRSAILQGSWGG